MELLRWFQANAKPLASGYEGAIRMVADVAFPGRVHFVAHAVRDIVNMLPNVLDPSSKGSRIEYHCELDRIAKAWPSLGMLNASAAPPEEDTVTIPYKAAIIIDSLLVKHRENKQKPSSSERLIEILMRNEPTRAHANRRLVLEFEKMRDWFMARAHLRHNENPQLNEGELEGQFAKFEGILHSFVGNFFTAKAELDAILQQTND